MKKLFDKIIASFKSSLKGEESTQILIWWWGVIGYLVAYFIIERLIKISGLHLADALLSLVMITYFSWHIFALKKCSPKKTKPSKEEKQKLKIEARKNLGKSFARKLFLQEPITNWDPVVVTMVIDVFCIANFLEYVI